MKLKISHVTEYHYEEPSVFSLQRLRLTPPTVTGQTILNWSLHVEGAKPEVEYDDQFGNHINLVSLEGEQQATRIVAEGEVETEDRNGVLGPHSGFCPLWLFLRETPRTKPGKLIKDLTKSVSGDNELARMHALMSGIHEMVAYRPGTSDTETTAEQALEKKSGVCQDHAHIFVAAARSLGVPARYVSGYLMMEEKVEQAATHAWGEAHVAGLGWVGFDPANNICPDARYVRVASGLCYRDAAPVSGMRIGTPGEKLSVVVKVEDRGQMQSQSQS
ncbi:MULTISPECIES: transglutaminase family protein [unclassified Rhizobium]|uniref:transglutaminase family protein n=1 Tax=unclassified Rhizobium TaxID=2613769 RepID=UPI00160DD67C|nr:MULTISPECIES: transglutaminase family protein [unclassified Rhizobium]MBB3541059.1 transglutaminase-like putative cysteine protease [Rhizobium sp. BK399]MCS3743828.1 transglutaminase-like putative cysteine protease [Rhizobium sp. BK661]MCS4093737.1 transglutaminase-like putative cysteine protease [Rhizobium sp. BK176]